MSTKTKSRAATGTSRKVVAKATTTNKVQARDAFGRFTSKMVPVSSAKSRVRPKPGATTSRSTSRSASTIVKTKASSFVKSMVVNADNTISVVMKRNPKTTYNYRVNAKSLSAVRQAIAEKSSLGSVYNRLLRGNEISRVIYR